MLLFANMVMLSSSNVYHVHCLSPVCQHANKKLKLRLIEIVLQVFDHKQMETLTCW